MERTMRVAEAPAVPEDAEVLDYDELGGRMQNRFPDLARQAPTETPLDDAKCNLPNRVYVKFVDYYRLECRAK